MAMPFITIVLDKPRHLRFGMGAMVEFEQLTGQKILTLDLENIGITDAAYLLLSGLRHEDKELTLEKMLAIIDDNIEPDGLMELIEPAMKALYKAFDTGEQPKNGKAPKAKKS